MQPEPTLNNNRPIWELVMEEMKARHELGIKRYGVPLQANNGRDCLRDLFEELLDAVAYTKQMMEERKSLEAINEEYEDAIDENISDLEDRLDLCLTALEEIANDTANRQALIAQQILNTMDDMDRCAVHGIPFKDCDC